MLRKNCFPSTVSVQTDEFLFFLPMEQKLTNLLEKYQDLQQKYKEVQGKAEYFKFRNQLLENSLHELTFVFNNKLIEGNGVHLKDIRRIEDMIESEIQSLKGKQDQKGQEVQKNKSDNHPITEFKQKRDPTSMNGNIECQKSKKSDIIHDKISKKASLQENKQQREVKGNPLSERRVIGLNQCQNQFLPQNSLQATQARMVSIKYRQNSQCMQKQAKTERYTSSIPLSSRQKRVQKYNQKQNKAIQKLTKREAELNLKTFITNFNESSRLEQKSLNSTSNIESSRSWKPTPRYSNKNSFSSNI